MLQNKISTGTKWDDVLKTADGYRYIIPKSYKEGMLVNALIFASPQLIEYVCRDLSLEQAANVATLPGGRFRYQLRGAALNEFFAAARRPLKIRAVGVCLYPQCRVTNRWSNAASKILSITDCEDYIEILTTTEWLAVRIGKEMEKAFKGKLEIKRPTQEQFVQVRWSRPSI